MIPFDKDLKEKIEKALSEILSDMHDVKARIKFVNKGEKQNDNNDPGKTIKKA